MDYTGIPTPQLEVAAMAKKDDLVVGSQDGKSRNFRVEDIRGINDNKKGKDTTYSSEQIEKLISALTNLSNEDITVLVNAVGELNNTVNSNKEEVNKELENRYTKSETFNQDEVRELISDLINSAPETLDTLKEIADALNNDADFAGTMTKELAKKANTNNDDLNTNDKTLPGAINELKENVDSNTSSLNDLTNKNEYDLLLADGYKAEKVKYSKDCFNRVLLTIYEVAKNDNSEFTAGKTYTIGQLPEGFIPTTYTFAEIIPFNTGANLPNMQSYILIDINGRISVIARGSGTLPLAFSGEVIFDA